MCDHVVQLTGNAGPLAAGSVLEQGAGDVLARRALHQCLLASAGGGAYPCERRAEHRQQQGQDVLLGVQVGPGHQGYEQEDPAEDARQHLGAPAPQAGRAGEAGRSGARHPIEHDQLDGGPSYGQVPKQDKTKKIAGCGGNRRWHAPEQGGRERGAQRQQCGCEHVWPAVWTACCLRGRFDDRNQGERADCDSESRRTRQQAAGRVGPAQDHALHCDPGA